MKETGANARVIFVPPPFAADAIMEAADAGIPLHRRHHRGHPGARHGAGASAIAGQPPDVPADRPELPGRHHARRSARSASCPATSTGRAASAWCRARARSPTRRCTSSPSSGLGQSTAVGIGGDPVNGTDFIDVLKLFKDDPETDAVIMIGEIGGSARRAARRVRRKHDVKKPVVGFIAGRTAPPGKRMGHAGAIISGGKGTRRGEDQGAWRPRASLMAAAAAELGTTLQDGRRSAGAAKKNALAVHLSHEKARGPRTMAIERTLSIIKPDGWRRASSARSSPASRRRAQARRDPPAAPVAEGGRGLLRRPQGAPFFKDLVELHDLAARWS